MITWVTSSVAAWLIKHNAISQDEKELYEYAVYSFIIFFFPLLLACVVGTCIGMLVESVLLILPFTFIRKFSGGFHTKRPWTCLVSSVFTLILCIYMTTKISYNWLFVIITLCAVASLCVCSPIDSVNRRLEPEEKRKYKKITIGITVFFLMIFGVLSILKFRGYAVCISVGIMLSASSQIPYMLKEIIKKHSDVAIKNSER